MVGRSTPITASPGGELPDAAADGLRLERTLRPRGYPDPKWSPENCLAIATDGTHRLVKATFSAFA